MKKPHNDGVNREIARLKALRLALVCIGVLLSIAAIVVYMLYDPLQVTGSETDDLPQNVITMPQETQLGESETEETIQMPETFPDGSDEASDANAAEDLTQKGGKKDVPAEDIQKDEQHEKEKSPEDDMDTEKQEENPSVEPRQVEQSVSLAPANRKEETEPPQPIAAVPENTADVEQQAPMKVVFLILCVLLGMDIAAIIAVSAMISIRKKAVNVEQNPQTNDWWTPNIGLNGEDHSTIQVAGLHNIGARPYQEDSLGADVLKDGVLAVVADGMGGLSGGDRVSQKIVYTMLEYGKKLSHDQMDGALEMMLNGVNQEVNRMLGPDGLYKSGSTLLAVLICKNRFHWITVGDSRIYYYHDRKLNQLNQEHNVGQDMLIKATRGELSFEEARKASKKGRVTSFIGMGKLKYVDKSYRSIELAAGDRVLLMTDGVFNTLSDQMILSVLENCPDIQMAAAKLEQLVLQAGHPKQDNFTAIILGR